MCRAFHGPKPTPEHEVAHWDGVRTNFVLSNLRWATKKENREDQKRHGTFPSCENNGRAVLSWAQVLEIREQNGHHKDKKRLPHKIAKNLSEKYGVSRNTIAFVIKGETWMGRDFELPTQEALEAAKLN